MTGGELEYCPSSEIKNKESLQGFDQIKQMIPDKIKSTSAI